MKSSLSFLQKVFAQQCQTGDYIFLSLKGPGIKWKDFPIKYDGNIKINLQRFFKRYDPKTYELYWSPMPYSNAQRQLVNARDTKFLVQDIDEYEDVSTLEPPPTHLWESSPNKYQGMWELDRYINLEEYTPLNKALAKHIGCDDCFDYPHVYRIPGTYNHKYKNTPQVSMVSSTNKIYKPRNLKKLLKVVNKSEPATSPISSDMAERKIYAKYSIPKKVRDLLALDDLTGIDRSSTIWHIENSLHELGMTPNEIIYLIKNSAFNKYGGRSDEAKMLKAELNKIISGSLEKQAEANRPLKVTDLNDLMMDMRGFGGWLVRGFWGRRSHGIVAGMPKCFKSTLVHDLAVSVASGTKFLGKYEVEDPGPVIIVQNENADYMMRDRTEKVMLHRNIVGSVKKKGSQLITVRFAKDLPISFLNQQGFVINNEEHRKGLEKLIKQQKPVLVILDPLYLMFEGDLNSAKELNPVLSWLLYLKTEYNTSVMLIHHYNKGNANSPKGGARMMGSIILYGWVESAWYLAKEEKDEEEEAPTIGELNEPSTEPVTVTLAREFRMSGYHPPLDIELTMGEIDNPKYHIETRQSGKFAPDPQKVKDELLNLLGTTPQTKQGLNERFAHKGQTLQKALDELLQEGHIKKAMGRYIIKKRSK